MKSKASIKGWGRVGYMKRIRRKTASTPVMTWKDFGESWQPMAKAHEQNSRKTPLEPQKAHQSDLQLLALCLCCFRPLLARLQPLPHILELLLELCRPLLC